MHDFKALCTAFGLALVAVGCTGQGDTPPMDNVTSGELTIVVDEEVAHLFDSSFALYRREYPNVTIVTEVADARNAMNRVLTRSSPATIVARDYLPDERAAIAETSVPIYRTHVASDALVFFVRRDASADTIAESAVREALSVRPGTGLRFVTTRATSSIVGYLQERVLQGKPPVGLTGVGTIDSCKTFVKQHGDYVGIGLLSQLHGDTTVKMLKVSWTDSTGAYRRPVPVHAAYVVQGLYPYKVPIYMYARSQPHFNNLASGVIGYVYQNAGAQRSFLKAGILPEFAKLVLVPEGQE